MIQVNTHSHCMQPVFPSFYTTTIATPTKAPTPTPTHPSSSPPTRGAPPGATLLIWPVTPAPATAVHDAPVSQAKSAGQHPPPKDWAHETKLSTQAPPPKAVGAGPAGVSSCVKTMGEPPVLPPTGTRIVTPFATNVDVDVANTQFVSAQFRPTTQHPGRKYALQK